MSEAQIKLLIFIVWILLVNFSGLWVIADMYDEEMMKEIERLNKR